MHQEPAILHNRSVGYGLVTFNKKDRTIKTDCIRRFKDPTQADAQYPGWPVTIRQEDNFGKAASAWLPELDITTDILPVLKIYNDQKELVYSLRLPNKHYQAKVFKKGRYTLHLLVPETGAERILELKARKRKGGKRILMEM